MSCKRKKLTSRKWTKLRPWSWVKLPETSNLFGTTSRPSSERSKVASPARPTWDVKCDLLCNPFQHKSAKDQVQHLEIHMAPTFEQLNDLGLMIHFFQSHSIMQFLCSFELSPYSCLARNCHCLRFVWKHVPPCPHFCQGADKIPQQFHFPGPLPFDSQPCGTRFEWWKAEIEPPFASSKPTVFLQGGKAVVSKIAWQLRFLVETPGQMLSQLVCETVRNVFSDTVKIQSLQPPTP